MAASIFQRMRLALRGWSRRRSTESARKQDEFLQRSAGWIKPSAPTLPAKTPTESAPGVDLEGLQVAYLEDSGRMVYYLDTHSGELIEFVGSGSPEHDVVMQSPARYRQVPERTAESDAADRLAFVATLPPSPQAQQLAAIAIDGTDFRARIGTDRTVERAWYNFKNDRALDAIKSWLGSLGP